MNKLFSAEQRALFKKDFSELRRPSRFNSLLWVPLLLAVGLPILFIFVSLSLPMDGTIEMEPFERILPAGAAEVGVPGVAFYAFSNLLCPLLFVLVPLITASIVGASAFMSEREHGTMETLLYTPLSPDSIYYVKALGSVLISLVFTLFWFVLFFICMIVGAAVTGAPFFFNWNWLLLVLLLSPMLAFLGVTWMAAISVRVKTVHEAVQTASYIIFPILLLFAVQLMGVFLFSPLVLLITAALAGVLGFFLLRYSRKKFTPERLLSR